MRKKPIQTYASTNSPAGRNGNYSVTLDFSQGSRGTVEVRQQPERITFTQTLGRNQIKK